MRHCERDALGRMVGVSPPILRFIEKCRFEPETGCVIWTGGRTQGRGHHVPYGSFWFEGRRWFAHRWAAKYIHNLEIEEFDVDHCCDTIPIPNTLCVQHVQSKTPAQNRELQTMRKHIHVQVGLVKYTDAFGPMYDPDHDLIPFYSPPAWLTQGTHDATRRPLPDCPF